MIYPTLAQAAWTWARIAALSFGGPAGQIAVMHRILVEEKRWLGDGRFLHALNFCMILPGPEAMQLATYIGWLMHGLRGALVAGGLFLLPGVVAIMGLSWAYAAFGALDFVAALFLGLKAAVLAIVLQAVVRVGRRVLKTTALRVIAVLSFLAIFAFALPFPVIIALAALAGWALARRPGFHAGGHGAMGQVPDAETLLGATLDLPATARRGALWAGLAALALWLVPVAALMIWAPASVFTEIATFFSRMAVLTFGGAYAVLAWVAQEAVGHYGWLTPTEMMDGLGLAETTPGPLILVLQFVGFLAAFREAGGPPFLAGTLGGLLATWVTFVPCFAWIFLGAPFMERLRAHAPLAGALQAVTAAVVGVIANLALWFALHVIWTEVTRVTLGPLTLDLPRMGALDPVAAGLSVLAVLAVFWLRLGMATVLAGAAGLGLGLHLIGLA